MNIAPSAGLAFMIRNSFAIRNPGALPNWSSRSVTKWWWKSQSQDLPPLVAAGIFSFPVATQSGGVTELHQTDTAL